MPGSDKHLLDSSVVRSLLASTEEHRNYFRTRLAGKRCYASAFVRMEVRRSLIAPLVDFWFCLKAPNRTGLADALQLWKNEFAKAHHIAVETLIASLFKNRNFDLNSLRDKETALTEVARYIRNIERKLRRCTDPGRDAMRCSRSAVALDAEMETLSDDLQRFADDFADTKHHESECRIEEFFLTHHPKRIEKYIELRASKPKPADQARGFVQVAEKLEKIRDSNGEACSCRTCGAVGDSVIALDAPREYFIEHTDYSFNYLCPPINQLHRIHPSALGMNRPDEREETDS